MTSPLVHALRDLPFSLSADQIKACAYQFNIRSTGETDIDIDDVHGKAVLLRSRSEQSLHVDFGLLVTIAGEVRTSRARGDTAPTPRAPAARFRRALSHEVPSRRPPRRPEELLGSSAFRVARDGRLALRGAAAELVEGLDAVLRGFAKREGAEPFHAEPVWHQTDLGGFGYGKENPYLYRVSHLRAEEPDYWQNAVCNNVWRYHAGLEIGGAPQVFTARGACCRHEGSQHFSLEYMRVFTMREVVMAGAPADLLRFRERGLDFVAGLAADLGLSGHCEEASDPFFLQGETDPLRRGPVELPDVVKIELRLPLYDDRTLACASFNVHGDFFARQFGYSSAGGSPVWTGCTAFGLERWVWAILVQHGPEPAEWPQRLRAVIGL